MYLRVKRVCMGVRVIALAAALVAAACGNNGAGGGGGMDLGVTSDLAVDLAIGLDLAARDMAGCGQYQCFNGPCTCQCPGSCIQDSCCDIDCYGVMNVAEGTACRKPGFVCRYGTDFRQRTAACTDAGTVRCVSGCDGGTP